MSTKSLDELLKEIETRAESATPGPWEAEYQKKDLTWPGLWKLIKGIPLSFGWDGEEGIYADKEEDIQFIAHARTDIPKLLAVIRKLIEQRDKRVPNNLMTATGLSERENAEIAKILEGEK